MTNTGNIGAQGVSWTVFGAECLNAVYDLRWMIILAVVLIGTDYWWGVQELSVMRKRAVTRAEQARYKFHFSQAGRRTLNKAVDYLTYLLVGCVAGLAITEPMGIATHTTTAAIGLGFGMLFELSSIVGHISVVKGVNIHLNLKKLIVAIIRHKSEEVAEILDEGIEDIEDNRRHHGIPPHMRHHGDCTISAGYNDEPMQMEDYGQEDCHHCGEDVEHENEENDGED